MVSNKSKKVDAQMLELCESIPDLLENELPVDTRSFQRLQGQLQLITEVRELGINSFEELKAFFKKAGVHAIDALFWGMKREGIPLSRMKAMTFEELDETVGMYRGVTPSRIRRFLEVRDTLFEIFDQRKKSKSS